MPRLSVAGCCVFLALPALVFAEEPDAIYKQGIAKLRDAQADHAALVPATKLLARAAGLYEAAGDEAKTAEVNSCLYWARKKMTLADTEAVKGDAVAVQRMETVAKAIPVSEAKAMLEKAEAFAKGHAEDPLLVSIRFFEIADRFADAPEGKKAMQQSLAAMQKIGEKAKLDTYKPAPTDGKAFIKSEPVGAAIILVNADGGKLDTGKVTPALIQLPVGKQSLELTLKAHKPSPLSVEVDGKTIAKPDAVKMEPLTVPVDIIFEDGWTVFLDGKPAKDAKGAQPTTPCTIELTPGQHALALAKDGYLDMTQRIEAKADSPIEIKQKPSKGTSTLLATPKQVTAVVAGADLTPYCGSWSGGGYKYELSKTTDGFSLTEDTGSHSLKSVQVGNSIVFEWSWNNDAAVLVPSGSAIVLKRYWLFFKQNDFGASVKLPDRPNTSTPLARIKGK